MSYFNLYLNPIASAGLAQISNPANVWVLPPAIPWIVLAPLLIELNSKVEDVKNKGAIQSRSGDFNAAAAVVKGPTLPSISNLFNAPGHTNTPPGLWEQGDRVNLAGRLTLLLLSYQLKGNYYVNAHNFSAASGQFSHAESLYGAMLEGAPPQTVTPGLSTIRYYLSNTFGLSRAERHRYLNKLLICANSSVPAEYAGWASVKQSEAVVNFLRWLRDPEKQFTEEEVIQELNGLFAAANGKLETARGAMEAFKSFLRTEYGEGTEAYHYFVDLTKRKIAKVALSIKISQAACYLHAATWLRVNNPEVARALINRALELLIGPEGVLKGELFTNPPQEYLSALTTLAWAHTSLANLNEEEERGSGMEDAIKAGAIYKLLLQGESQLTSQELELLKAEWPNLTDGPFGFIRNSLQSILSGGDKTIWSGTTPELPLGATASLDLVGFCGTNELELMLNMADNYKTARNYIEALRYYQEVLKLEANKKAWMSEVVFDRARTGIAQVLNQLADDIHGRNHDYDEAVRLLTSTSDLIFPAGENQEITIAAGSIKLCETTLQNLINLNPNSFELAQDEWQEFRYRNEMLKAATTLAWAYSSQSRYLRELGWVDEAYEFARKAEALYLALRGERHAEEDSFTDQNFKKILLLIRSNFPNLSPLKKHELVAEVNLPKSSIDFGIAEALKLQRKFTEAATIYQVVISEFKNQSTGSRYYQKALLGLAEAQLEQAKIFFSQSGNIESALTLLNQIQETLTDKTINNTSGRGHATQDEWLRGKMLLAQVFGTRGYLYIQKLDRNTGKQQLNEAIAIYAELAQNIENGLYTEDTLKEAYLTLSQLYLSWGSILALQGERDEMICQEDGSCHFAKLEEAKEKFERAIELFGAEGSTTRTSLGKLEAQAALFELLAMQAKLYLYRGNYQEAKTVIDSAFASSTTLSEEDILKILEKGAPRLAYRALTLYAWMLNLRGSMKERLEGEGTGREDFLSAADIYAALYGDETANSSALLDAVKGQRQIFTNENFLILLQTTRGQIKLMQAESLKSAAVRESKVNDPDNPYPLHQRAEDAYGQAMDLLMDLLENIDSTHELYYFANLAIRDVLSGSVENEINRGKLEEEAGSFAAAGLCYKNALNIATHAAQILIGNPLRKYLMEARAGARVISALGWCLDSLGEWRENQGYDTEGGNAPLQYRTALLIYRALVIGDDPHNLRYDHGEEKDKELFADVVDEWSGQGTPLGVNLDSLLAFIRDNRLSGEGSIFLTDEVLFAAEQNKWAAKYIYLYNLTASKFYKSSVDYYNGFISQLEGESYLGPKELEYLARSHALIGDVYTFRLADYDTAEGIYEKAQARLDEYNGHYGYYREMEELQQYVNGGFAKVYIEQGHYQAAVDKYQAILKCRFFKKLSLELLGDRDLEKIRELRRIITFKQFQILTRAYLGLGDVYTHYLKKSQKALKYLNAALFLLEQENFALAPIRRFLAQAHLGLGNVYQLRLKDYEKAINCFTAGLQVLARVEEVNEENLRAILDVKSRELVVRLLTSLSAVYAEQDLKAESEKVEALAKSILEDIPDDPYDPDLIEIRELFGETQVGNEGTLQSQAHLTLEPFFSWISTSRGGETSWSGPSFGLRAGFGLAHDLRLNLDYQATLPVDSMTIQFKNQNSGEEINRLIFDDSHSLALHLSYEHDWDFVTTRLNAGITYGLQNFTLNQCNWGPAFQHCSDPTTLEQKLSTLRLHLQNEWLWNYSIDPDTTFLAGGSIGASFLYRFGLPPIYQSQIISYQEQINSLGQAIIPDAVREAQQEMIENHITEVGNQEDPYYFSFFLNPQLGFQFAPWHIGDNLMLYYPSIFLGAHLGYEPDAVTDQGRWPLYTLDIGENGEPTFAKLNPFRAAITASFSGIFAFGEDFRFKIPLHLGAQAGWWDSPYVNDYFNFDVNAGFNFGLDWLELLFGYSRYQDENHNQSDTFNFFLRFIPWF
jgi:tetratricopeptide (TPR) repeat protein